MTAPDTSARALRGTLRRLCGIAALAACCTLAPAASARAQVSDTPPEAQGQLGPIFFNPGMVFSSGYDTNPWRESQADAVRDVYETYVTPQIFGWMTLGHLRADFFGALEVVKAGEGVAGKNYQGGSNVVWNGPKLSPYLTYTNRHTNANPTGFEVGRKSMRIEQDVKVGTSLKLGSAVRASTFVRRTKTNWDADAIYQTSSLREKLNRADEGFGAGLEFSLTPLTSLRFTAETTRSDFVYSPIRNGSGYRVAPGLSIVGPAAINANVDIGVRQFRSTTSDVSFRGLVSNTSVNRAFSTGTVLAFRFDRDLQFSYDTSLAYFVGQSIELTAIQPLGENLALQVYVGRHRLLYNETSPIEVPLNAVSEVGVAVGRRFRQRMRIGAMTEWASSSGNQAWDQLRVVGFLTYGSGQFQRLDRPIPFQR